MHRLIGEERLGRRLAKPSSIRHSTREGHRTGCINTCVPYPGLSVQFRRDRLQQTQHYDAVVAQVGLDDLAPGAAAPGQGHELLLCAEEPRHVVFLRKIFIQYST